MSDDKITSIEDFRKKKEEKKNAFPRPGDLLLEGFTIVDQSMMLAIDEQVRAFLDNPALYLVYGILRTSCESLLGTEAKFRSSTPIERDIEGYYEDEKVPEYDYTFSFKMDTPEHDIDVDLYGVGDRPIIDIAPSSFDYRMKESQDRYEIFKRLPVEQLEKFYKLLKDKTPISVEIDNFTHNVIITFEQYQRTFVRIRKP